MVYAWPVIETIVRFMLRLPADLHATLTAWAAEENRSLNGQIVHLLRQAAAERRRQRPT